MPRGVCVERGSTFRNGRIEWNPRGTKNGYRVRGSRFCCELVRSNLPGPRGADQNPGMVVLAARPDAPRNETISAPWLPAGASSSDEAAGGVECSDKIRPSTDAMRIVTGSFQWLWMEIFEPTRFAEIPEFKCARGLPIPEVLFTSLMSGLGALSTPAPNQNPRCGGWL